ncbi:hypothetical protein HBB16_08725 [Pseudonocardia sp. MCCB 268]|nr:hypothetical protein [Pseudonocardia cytotoxica]
MIAGADRRLLRRAEPGDGRPAPGGAVRLLPARGTRPADPVRSGHGARGRVIDDGRLRNNSADCGGRARPDPRGEHHREGPPGRAAVRPVRLGELRRSRDDGGDRGRDTGAARRRAPLASAS